MSVNTRVSPFITRICGHRNTAQYQRQWTEGITRCQSQTSAPTVFSTETIINGYIQYLIFSDRISRPTSFTFTDDLSLFYQTVKFSLDCLFAYVGNYLGDVFHCRLWLGF